MAAIQDSGRARLGYESLPESFRPIARLLGGLWAVESVRKVKLSSEGSQVDLWVLVEEDVPEDESHIWRLERDYRIAAEPPAFELHLIALSEVDETLLPPAETILQR